MAGRVSDEAIFNIEQPFLQPHFLLWYFFIIGVLANAGSAAAFRDFGYNCWFGGINI
jgi:hypothetical protein